jgi:hypothetical protein
MYYHINTCTSNEGERCSHLAEKETIALRVRPWVRVRRASTRRPDGGPATAHKHG